MFSSQLPPVWRERAEILRPYAPNVAKAFARAADELEEEIHAYLTQVLTPDEAAGESGYHPETVREKLRTGKWPNVGKRGRPRVRRMDMQPKGRERLRGCAGTDVEGIVRDAVASRVTRQR